MTKQSNLIGLLAEIDCRIEHGSNDNGHLNYVRVELEKIIYGHSDRNLDKEIEDRNKPQDQEPLLF